MSRLFDATRSRLIDPQFEDRTTEPRKSAWLVYAKALEAALDRFDAEKAKARSEYLLRRGGYLRGSILQPTLGQVLLAGWPTDTQLAEFNEREAGQLAEFEKEVFIAARSYAWAERDARLVYWNTIEDSEGKP